MPAQLSFNQAQKSIRKAAKRVLTEKGLNPTTRKGNKEFDLLLQQLRSASFASNQAAIAAGEQLGQKIVELSQQQGKQDLDRGVIRQMALTTNWLTELGLTVASAAPPATPPAVIDQPTPAAPPSFSTPETPALETVTPAITETEVPPESAAETLAADPEEPETAPPDASDIQDAEVAVAEAATDEMPDEMPVETETVQPEVDQDLSAAADESETNATVEIMVEAADRDQLKDPTESVAEEPVAQ
ncbi:hypothetical protein [Almyronema epifaneia]|uniref:Uncharacterized protein n=1 Tax=Almyronema epifaneia S1 TaxID=2991925 RepID=A0ABW6IG30_9CYAN